MVCAILLFLYVEQILGIADMLLQIRRHCIDWLEQSGKDAPISADDRVGAIRDIKLHRPIIGIDRYLD
jgi:hypothetical protein